jgi:hypothetical protein
MEKIAKVIIWILVSIVLAVSFAMAPGILHPAEKINALWLIVATACFYTPAYRFYGTCLATRAAIFPVFSGSLSVAYSGAACTTSSSPSSS